MLAAVDCAATGLGIAAAPEFMASRHAHLARIRRPREMGGSPVFLVAHKDVVKIPRVRATLNRLYPALKVLLNRGEGDAASQRLPG